MTPRQQKALINKIIKQYGPVIDIEKSPEVLIDILRAFGRQAENGDGGLPGGVGSPPPCIVEREVVLLDDLMLAVMKLSRDVATIKAAVAPKRAKD